MIGQVKSWCSAVGIVYPSQIFPKWSPEYRKIILNEKATSPVTTLPTTTSKFRWMIPDFSTISETKTRVRLISDVFTAGGYQWSVCLYHRGSQESDKAVYNYDSGDKGCLVVYVALANIAYKDEAVYASFDISLKGKGGRELRPSRHGSGFFNWWTYCYGFEWTPLSLKEEEEEEEEEDGNCLIVDVKLTLNDRHYYFDYALDYQKWLYKRVPKSKLRRPPSYRKIKTL